MLTLPFASGAIAFTVCTNEEVSCVILKVDPSPFVNTISLACAIEEVSAFTIEDAVISDTCTELETTPDGSCAEEDIISVPLRLAIVWAELDTISAGSCSEPEIVPEGRLATV